MILHYFCHRTYTLCFSLTLFRSFRIYNKIQKKNRTQRTQNKTIHRHSANFISCQLFSLIFFFRLHSIIIVAAPLPTLCPTLSPTLSTFPYMNAYTYTHIHIRNIHFKQFPWPIFLLRLPYFVLLFFCWILIKFLFIFEICKSEWRKVADFFFFYLYFDGKCVYAIIQ